MWRRGEYHVTALADIVGTLSGQCQDLVRTLVDIVRTLVDIVRTLADIVGTLSDIG
jgi:hypothetical protein